MNLKIAAKTPASTTSMNKIAMVCAISASLLPLMQVAQARVVNRAGIMI